MGNIVQKTTRIVEQSYKELHRSVFRYIYYKIGNREEAEDLMQDVLVRLMEYKQMLCEETARSFIFTIARNIVTDYLRHYYKKQEVNAYMFDTTVSCSNETESIVIANDLAARERSRMRVLPPQRRTIYYLNRFEEKGSPEVAKMLHLSRRTVENHLLIARKQIREYMRRCI